MDEIEIKLITPSTLTREMNEQIVTLGWETANLLQVLEYIKYELDLDTSKRPSIVWQLIQGLLSALASDDRNQVHYAIAREALKGEDVKIGNKPLDRESAEYKNIIGIMASLINDHCHKLKACIEPPITLKNSMDCVINIANEATIKNSVFDVIEWPAEFDALFADKGLFTYDKYFLKYLKTTGKNGKQFAKNLEPDLKQDYILYCESGKSPLNFWFNIQPSVEKPLFISDALVLLTKALWRDHVSRKSNLIIRGIPALIENDQEHILAMLSRGNKIKETDKQIQVYNQDVLLGSTIPTISSDIINTVFNGIKKFNTVEGHRALRYLPRTALNQMISGHTDYRVITRNSYSEICEELELKSKKHVSSIKEIFHAMAYFEFKRPKFSGNLIALKKIYSEKTHRKDGVEITVGTILLPYRACEEFKNGESNLLIPIMSDPILVGSNQYHAGQYLLQMHVMKEFCKQSVNLAKHGFIEISEELWISMARQCGLLPILTKILDQWTQDGSSFPKFLEKKDKDLYTLGHAHKRELDFLIRQGNHRIYQSNRGIASASKKKKHK